MTVQPNTPVLRADRLARRHPNGRQWLLDHVSIDVPAGTCIAVTGPSGSGKTLLLRALALLDPLDAGEVRFNGRPVRGEHVPKFRRWIVYLHQRPTIAEEGVEAALRRPFSLSVHRDRSFDRGRIVDLLGQLGREENFLAKTVGNLSGGERQIVALLRAVQLDPNVLLLDEPTAALDRRTAMAVETLLGHWIKDGRAAVWVTHGAEQAARVGQQTLRMQRGAIHER